MKRTTRVAVLTTPSSSSFRGHALTVSELGAIGLWQLILEAVTTVGATQGAPEIVAPFSAGGFSNIFSRPAYQNTAVTAFLSTIPANFSGVFNRTGRAYPDVAMQGVNYTGVYGGTLYLNSGTSASAPAFASLIALLNARLVSDGRARLGFLNREPWWPWYKREPRIKQTCSVPLRRGRSSRRIQRHNRGEQHWRGTA
jgi:hypothetical protein